MFACGADLDFAVQLVALVGTGRELVAKEGLAMFLGPARIGVLLAAFGKLPVGRRLALFQCGLFLFAHKGHSVKNFTVARR